MWVRSSSEISPNVRLVTTAVSSHFLVSGAQTALIDASVFPVQERLATFVKECLKGQALDYILLTHAHFDHIGGVAYLRQAFPTAKLIAGPQTAQVLGDVEQQAELYTHNTQLSEVFSVPVTISEEQFSAALELDRIVSDGDLIDLGDGVDVKVVGSPGHSEDSLSYYVRPDSALYGGEALGGYHGRSKLSACFASSYKAYIESLEKLSRLEIKIVGLAHSGVLTGDLASNYLAQQRQEAERFHELIRARLEHGEIIEEVYNGIYPELYEANISPEGPFAKASIAALMNMIKVVAEQK